MFTDKLSLRIAWPTMLVAALLFAASAAAAVLLQLAQARTAQLLQNSVHGRTAAQNLETTLENLISMLRRGSIQVQDLNDHIHNLLAEARDLSDQAEEEQLVDELWTSFEKFDTAWRELLETQGPPKKGAIEPAVKILEVNTLPLARRLRTYQGREIDQSEKEHAQTVRRMAWGLVGVGVVGALGGILFGYSVARGLRRSIYRLSVRIRDAADRLGHELPAITVDEKGDLPQLQNQMKLLAQEIERVVRELDERDRELMRAEQLRAVGQLAAGAAHELRNPLTAIKMLIQTNREEAAERGLPTEDLNVIDGEVRRMERCLNTLLDLARPPKPHRHPFDLATVVDKTVALLSGRARHQGVQVHVCPPECPIYVNADPEQVQQVLVNLCLNALDAMPGDGTLTIDFGLTAPDSAGHANGGPIGEAALVVQDTGPGIAPALLPRLFEPFVSSKETGLGLGLAVSRRIAEAHGGSLKGSNRPEGGACFEFRLPTAMPAKAGDRAHLAAS